MTDEHEEHRAAPEPPLGPSFPEVKHPDLDAAGTEEVGEPPNKDDVKPELAGFEIPD